MQPYLTFSMQHVEIVIQMDKRALVRQGVFSSARTRGPTSRLDEPYEKQMDDLIHFMLHSGDDVKPAGSATRSLALSSTLLL